jgi:hypothetical protein
MKHEILCQLCRAIDFTCIACEVECATGHPADFFTHRCDHLSAKPDRAVILPVGLAAAGWHEFRPGRLIRLLAFVVRCNRAVVRYVWPV